MLLWSNPYLYVSFTTTNNNNNNINHHNNDNSNTNDVVACSSLFPSGRYESAWRNPPMTVRTLADYRPKIMKNLESRVKYERPRV